MGVIKRQGIKYTVVSYIGVLIGLVSMTFIYPQQEELYGLFRILFESATILSSIFSFGLVGNSVRFFPRFENKENGHNGLMGFLFIGGLVGFLIFLILFPFGKDLFVEKMFADSQGRELVDQYFIVVVPLVFLFIFSSIQSKYVSNFQRIVIPNILNDLLLKFTLPILVLLVIVGDIDTGGFVVGVLVHFLVVLVGLLLYTVSLGQWHLKPRFDFMDRKLIKDIGEYSFYGVLTTLGGKMAFFIDTLMVSAMISVKAGGGYAIVRIISEVITKPSQAIVSISAPIISRSWSTGDTDEIKMIYRKSSTTLLIIGLYIFLGVWCSIEDLFSLMVESTAKTSGKYIFLFLAGAKLLDLATSVNSPIIAHSKKFRFNFYALLILAVLNIIFNYLFIKEFDIVGAAVATFCSMFLFNLAKLLFIWFQFGMQPFSKSTLKIAAIALMAYLAVSFIPLSFHPFINIIVRSILLSIVYLSSVYYFKVSEDVNKIALDLWRKVKR